MDNKVEFPQVNDSIELVQILILFIAGTEQNTSEIG